MNASLASYEILGFAAPAVRAPSHVNRALVWREASTLLGVLLALVLAVVL